MFWHGFTLGPVLQVKPKNGGMQVALTYMDTIKRYGNRVKEAELSLAYERAGTSFVGQMRQNFVVLTDKGVKRGGRMARGGGESGSGPVFLSGGNKRALEEGKDKGSLAKRQVGKDGTKRGGNVGGSWKWWGRWKWNLWQQKMKT